jgi:hypothetical protein
VSISVTGRALWAVVGAVSVGLLATAATLKPDPRGFGTHEQLGGGPCVVPLLTGLPCPTCGMTTSFALAVHGRPLDALAAQPAGFALCIATVGLAILSICVTAVGRVPWINWDRVGAMRLALGLVFILVAGWVFKILTGLTAAGIGEN